MVYGATWSPEYDLRVDTLTDSVSCTYFGRVTQTTTEDWEGKFHSPLLLYLFALSHSGHI